MSKTTETANNDRRAFLKRALATGGTLGVAMSLDATAQVPGPSERTQTQARPERPRYRETAHVREYYTKASL
jgi:hypothetical protein